MTDRQAERLLELLGKYAATQYAEDASLSSYDVGAMTVLMVMNDLIAQLPASATVVLPIAVREITGD
jgi:roadblock/LC7 domain-containing protein